MHSSPDLPLASLWLQASAAACVSFGFLIPTYGENLLVGVTVRTEEADASGLPSVGCTRLTLITPVGVFQSI